MTLLHYMLWRVKTRVDESVDESVDLQSDRNIALSQLLPSQKTTLLYQSSVEQNRHRTRIHTCMHGNKFMFDLGERDRFSVSMVECEVTWVQQSFQVMHPEIKVTVYDQ